MGSVLIVDDNLDTCRFLCSAVGKAGHRGAFANSVGEALERIRRQVPDLVIADLMMPDDNGIELVRALRRDPRTRELPVIMCSAVDEPRYVAEAMEAGATDYWLKTSLRVDDFISSLDAYIPNGGSGWAEPPGLHPVKRT